MAKVKPSIIEESGTIGDRVYYTRFGKTFSRRRPTQIKDQKSEAQLCQRALFKARQATSALYGSILQRGLTKEAHENGMIEANYFSRLNKDCFVYEEGTVRINYPALILARGPIPVVDFTGCCADGLHVVISFRPCLGFSKARTNDVVHIYAVSPEVEICQLVASVKRQIGQADFDLPDMSEETNVPVTFYLNAIVESAATAGIPTLSAAEKQANKRHRNINRRVSPSIFIGTINVDCSNNCTFFSATTHC